jgi:hypothetical protein
MLFTRNFLSNSGKGRLAENKWKKLGQKGHPTHLFSSLGKTLTGTPDGNGFLEMGFGVLAKPPNRGGGETISKGNPGGDLCSRVMCRLSF